MDEIVNSLDGIHLKNEVDEKPFSLNNQAKLLINNQELSDVRFQIGDEKKLIYGHKTLLAMASDIFKTMFYCDHSLRMDGDQPIEIPDLTSTGFLNMIKYIYGSKIDLNLWELYETYKAGDKYKIYNLTSSLLDYVKRMMNESNSCLVYEQLIKIQPDNKLVNQAKRLIQFKTKCGFKSDFFLQIDLNTLLDLLDMDLCISEIELLKVCANWTHEEVLRLGLEPNSINKQNVFKPIKEYIKFSDLTLEALEGFSQIQDLLTIDELASLFLHLIDKRTPLSINCKTSRKKISLH